MLRRALACASLALALAVPGCSKSTKTTAPATTATGDHLLVFCSTRASHSASEYDVILYDADQSSYRTLTNLNSTYGQSEPCISNDGTFVCFASTRSGGYGGSDIYLYDRSKEQILATPGLNTSANETWPRFTHDSVHMAFVRDSLGVKRIKLYEPYGDSLISLPGLASSGATDDDAPAPDLHGNRIAFQSNRDGALHVYVWNRGGIASTNGLAGDSLDVEPSLSADGRWLAFASNRSGGSGGWDIYLYDLLAGAYVRLPRLNTAGDERHPSVSDNGQLLFFAARADSSQNWSIWRYTLADSNRTQPANLASSAGDDRQPYVRWR